MQPRFATGMIVMTPGVQALELDSATLHWLLRRHTTGDWGELDDHDKQENEYAVDKYLRILSAYNVELADKSVERIWLITEASRDRTTFLLPEEY
jgi:hypothetical protein